MRLLVISLLFCNVLATPLDSELLPATTYHPLHKRAGIVCFDRTSPQAEGREKIETGDCNELPLIISQGDKVQAPMMFSRDREKGFKLPHALQHKSCMIGFDSTVGEDDIATLEDIAIALLEIIIECVANVDAYGFGGGQQVGERGHLSAIILGVKEGMVERPLERPEYARMRPN
ncbi:hypothetical protein MMC13_000103 [Lambiella insularis]|nr:hypothetical protein [Lambiella insularis]